MVALAEAFVRVRPDTKGFRPETERVAAAAGRSAGTNFADRFRSRIDSAIKSLPKATIGVARNEAEQKVKDLRAALAALSDRTVGVDVDAATAIGDVRRLQAELAKLSAASPDIQVRADTAGAAVRLAEILAEAERLDGSNPRVRVDVDGAGATAELFAVASASSHASSRLVLLAQFGSALGPAIVPAAAAAAAALAAIGVAATAGIAGAGVAALGFAGVADAVKALDDAQQAAATSTDDLAGGQSKLASSTGQVRSAEASLANTRAQAAESARRAAEQVADAERDLTAAQRDARDVVRELDDARRDAHRRLADMNASLKDNALSQRQANLDVAEARRELDRVLADPTASQAQREQAQITYEREVLQLEDLKRRGKELADDTARANKAGVEGSTEVLAARKRIAQADERVAQAQRQLDEARRSQQSQQRQAAFQIAQAQQAVANAQRALRTATVKTGLDGAAAMSKLQQTMDRLPVGTQRFAEFLFGLRDELKSLRSAAANPLLPQVQTAIERLLPHLPALRAFVAEVAEELGRMAVNAADALNSSSYQRFFRMIRSDGIPALQGMARFAGNVSTGLVDLLVALSPFNRNIGGGLLNLSERFAAWADSLDRSDGFQDFLDYIADHGPDVVELLGELGSLFGRLVQATAPVGGVVLDALTALVKVINSIPVPILTAFVGALAAYSAVARTAAIATAVWTGATAAQARAQQVAAVAMNQYRAAAVNAALATGQTSGALTSVRTAAGLARTGAAGLVGLLGGPLGVALAGATVAIGVLSSASAKYHAKVDGLKLALGQLGSAYKDLTAQGKTAAQATDEALRGIVASNPDMQRAVVELDRLGIGFDQLSRAAGGSAGDMRAVLGALDQQIKVLGDRWQKEVLEVWDPGKAKATSDQLQLLRQMRKAIEENAGALTLQKQAVDIVNGSQGNLNMTYADWVRVYGPLTNEQYKRLTDAYDRNGARISVLQGLVNAFGSSQATAAQKAEALRSAIESQTSATVSSIERTEALRGRTLDLADAVKANGATLSLNTQAGLRNRDALQAAAGAVREMYLADIAAGKPIADVTKAHDGRIKALKEEAHRLGLDETETRKLIDAYGDVPKNVKTTYETKGFRQVFDELQKLQFAQFALKQGWSPAEAEKAWKKANTPAPRAFASGGLLHGPGTKTSDSIPLWGSRGEFMQQAKAVDYYGVDLMHAINQRKIPREALPGYAKGGPVSWPFVTDVRKTKVMTMQEALSKVVPVVAPGGIGSLNMMKLLHRAFPGLPLISGYRPGSMTLTGNLSYHARKAANGQEGRAVDVAPIRAVAEYIHRLYKGPTRELITPWQEFNLHNGAPHRYTGAVWNQHNFAGGNAHVHWALAQGGLITKAMAQMPPVRLFDQGGAWPSGTWGYNGSGRTEFVDPNFGGRGGGDTFNITFAGPVGSQRELEGWLIRTRERLQAQRRWK